MKNVDMRIVFRGALEELMTHEQLFDSDIEEVTTGIYYGRGIRTICVLDPLFEEQVDQLTNQFIEERKDDSTLLSQTYETLYGTVIVKTTSDKIVILLSDKKEKNDDRKKVA